MTRGLSMEEDLMFVSLLKSCAKTKDLNKGTKLHNDILRRGTLGKNPYIVGALITMYAKCGVLAKARRVLESIHNQNVVYWNALFQDIFKMGKFKKLCPVLNKCKEKDSRPTMLLSFLY